MPMVAVALLALTAAQVGLTDAELEKALRGDVATRSEAFTAPSGKASGRGVGAIVVDRGIAEVWAHVSRYEDKAEYTPRLKRVTVLEKKPGLLRVRMEVDASVMTAHYTAFFELDEKQHSIHWRLDRSAADNNISDADGSYRLFEVAPSRTLVVYYTWVDSGRSVPRFIQNYMTEKSIPNLLKAVKKRVESGGTYKK